MKDHELFANLLMKPRPHRFVDFPRKGADGKPVFRVGLVVLNQEEQMECVAAAEDFATERAPKTDSDAHRELYQNECAVEILYRSVRYPDDLERRVFPSPASIRETLTVDEIAVLFMHFTSLQSELGPIVAHMTNA